MNVVIFGPPGAGKGTQAQNIVKKFNLHQVSTGDLLRNEIENKSEIGIEIEEIISKGDFATDDIINKLLITNFEDKHELEKVGNNLFKPNEGITGEAIETNGIVQGFLETANINPVSEMVNLIDMHRQFEATQKTGANRHDRRPASRCDARWAPAYGNFPEPDDDR